MIVRLIMETVAQRYSLLDALTREFSVALDFFGGDGVRHYCHCVSPGIFSNTGIGQQHLTVHRLDTESEVQIPWDNIIGWEVGAHRRSGTLLK